MYGSCLGNSLPVVDLWAKVLVVVEVDRSGCSGVRHGCTQLPVELADTQSLEIVARGERNRKQGYRFGHGWLSENDHGCDGVPDTWHGRTDSCCVT